MSIDIYGRHDLMAIAAVRYCLGRMSYIVSDCCDWLLEVWPTITKSAQLTIKCDIEEAISDHDADCEEGRQHKRLGMDCDREQWERVRKLWSAL